jgi:maleate cis-trans isomerase
VKALKLGLMVPMNNTTMEGEMLAWLPAGSTCRTLRIPRGAGMLTTESVPAYVASAVTLAKDFAGGDYDRIAYGCTAAGFLSGPAADARLAKDLGQATGKPVVTTAQAMVRALQKSGAKNIAVVTPYLEPVNDSLVAFLENSGIKVHILKSFLARNTQELGSITEPQVDDLARKTMTDDCDGMFIACSQLPTRNIVEPLQRDFGRPVWSSIQATAWQILEQ